LAAILYPVFASAKAAAHRGTCISNFKQAHTASALYLSDYDDRFMPVNYAPGVSSGTSRTDRTWVQLLLPYTRSFPIFRCPSDHSHSSGSSASFDQDLVPGDTYARFYHASQRSNIGYNYLYLSPIVKMGNRWVVQTRSSTQVADPSRTLLFVDSIGVVSAGRSEETTGGSWLVYPPCRYAKHGALVYDSFQLSASQMAQGGGGPEVFTPTDPGWDVSGAFSSRMYGGAWPWHSGRMNVARVDGSVRSFAPSALSRGCDVQDNWAGKIFDPSLYMWDLQ
jgi:prepilin-type processing-associated H-X9-DG protein